MRDSRFVSSLERPFRPKFDDQTVSVFRRSGGDITPVKCEALPRSVSFTGMLILTSGVLDARGGVPSLAGGGTLKSRSPASLSPARPIAQGRATCLFGSLHQQPGDFICEGELRVVREVFRAPRLTAFSGGRITIKAPAHL